MMYKQDPTVQVLETVRHLCGPANNFVSENVILNTLRGATGVSNFDGNVKLLLTSLFQSNHLELFIPLVNNLCGSCTTGGCCPNGACGGGCCGCGRYYRVKIG